MLIFSYIHKDASPLNTSPLCVSVSTRNHPYQDPLGPECRGPKWDRPVPRPQHCTDNVPVLTATAS